MGKEKGQKGKKWGISSQKEKTKEGGGRNPGRATEYRYGRQEKLYGLRHTTQ